MPPKKKTTRTSESLEQPPKPDPNILNQAVPLDDKVVGLNNLAPYLAMGFMPVPTSGAESMCGLYSLKTSLLAAIKALNLTNVDLKLVTLTNLKKWLKGPEYEAKVEMWLNRTFPPDEFAAFELQNPGWKDLPGGYNEVRDGFFHGNNLEVFQLMLLLEVANEKLGTHFRLGQIVQGYWSRWDAKKKKKYDNLLHKTTVQLNLDSVAGHPVIFIYNENNSVISAAHNEKGKADHWEGFAPTTSDKKIQKARREWIQQEWEICDFIDTDLANGVWVVTQDNGGADDFAF